MEKSIVPWIFVAEIVLLGIVALVLPRIGRRGLLFGSYVGEETSTGTDAAALRRRWDRGVLAWTAACTLAAAALVILAAHPLAALAPQLVLAVAMVVLYLRLHREARTFAARAAAPVPPPPAVAGLSTPTRDPLPWIATIVGVAAGAIAIAYTAARYGAIPERVPVHFGLMGEPDRWAARSFGSVFVLPLMTLLMGGMIGGIAVLTSRAKRGLRAGDGGASLEAQDRFRRAIARFLAVLGLLVSAMLATMSVYAVRTATGAARGLPPWTLGIAGSMIVFCIGGTIYLIARYGQGGARMEARTGTAPLTDGLADDRFWKAGVFYVNPDDPSWLVEKRFGFGYTLNFGNRAAVVTLAAFFGLMIALAAWAVASS